MAEPKVRFKRDDGSSYPAWRTIPMSEVFTEISEKNHPELPVLSVQQGVGTVLRDSSDRNILYDKSNLKNYKAMKKDDYIIHLRSFEGGLECSNYDGISSPAYRILRSQAIVPAAYRDYFRSYEFIHNKLAVSVVGIRDGKNIDMDTFWQIPMSVPCIEEQQKIADFLSSVDAVIAASEEEVANLETQKKAVMKKIFSQEVRFKRADGSDFPEWEKKPLREEADFLSGLTYSPDDVVLDVNDGTLVLRSSNIQGGVIDYHDNVYVKTNIGNNLFVKEHDVLMCVRNGSKKLVGKTALISKADLGHTWGAFMMIIRSHTDNRFIYHYLNSDVFYNQMFPDVNTATIAQITKGMLNDCVLEMPCLEEQRLIADFLSDFDEAITAAKKELELWKELKKGLQQQMFV